MDVRLNKKLMDIEKHLTVLKAAEVNFLFLDAHKKVLFAQLFLKADGKNITERESSVYASQDWIDFSRGLAESESQYNHERRTLELLIKKYDGAHLTLKTESPVIKRQGA